MRLLTCWTCRRFTSRILIHSNRAYKILRGYSFSVAAASECHSNPASLPSLSFMALSILTPAELSLFKYDRSLIRNTLDSPLYSIRLLDRSCSFCRSSILTWCMSLFFQPLICDFHKPRTILMLQIYVSPGVGHYARNRWVTMVRNGWVSMLRNGGIVSPEYPICSINK